LLVRRRETRAVEPRCGHRFADLLLVAIHFGGVDVAVAHLEVRGRLLRVIRGDLVDTESELRNDDPVVQVIVGT
jgi:hypothetical protein